jgi:hypothetical protein
VVVDLAYEEVGAPSGYNCLKDHGVDDEDIVATGGNQNYIVAVVDIRDGGHDHQAAVVRTLVPAGLGSCTSLAVAVDLAASLDASSLERLD